MLQISVFGGALLLIQPEGWGREGRRVWRSTGTTNMNNNISTGTTKMSINILS